MRAAAYPKRTRTGIVITGQSALAIHPDRYAAVMRACAGAMFIEAVSPICAPGCRPDGHRISRGVRGRVRPLRSRRRLTRQARMGVPRDEGTDDSDYHEVRHRNADNAP